MDDNISFVKLYRKILGWEWYTDVPTKTLFIHLLIVANRYPARWRGQEIKTGQKITSLANLAEETGLTLKQVRTALKKLEKSGEITSKGANKFTLITIENYALYQGYDEEEGKQKANKGQTKGNQKANKGQTKGNKQESKESKESKEYNTPPISPSQGEGASEPTGKAIYNSLPTELKKAMLDFEKMRDRMRKPMTDRARSNLIKRLTRLSSENDLFDEKIAIEIVDRSIENGWATVYPLNNQNQSKNQLPYSGLDW